MVDRTPSLEKEKVYDRDAGREWFFLHGLVHVPAYQVVFFLYRLLT
jgi:hypothetical protein